MKLPKLGLRQALVLLYVTRPQMDDGFYSSQVNHTFGDSGYAALRALYEHKLVRKVKAKSGMPKTSRMWRVTTKGYKYSSVIESALDTATAQ